MASSGPHAASGTDQSALPGEPRPAIVAAFKRLLGPLVRLAIDHGILYPDFVDMLKEVFVEAAAHAARESGGRFTDSRLTLLSGVHRKEIRRLLREEQGEPAPPRLHHVGTAVVARWLSDARYMDAAGSPKPLPRAESAGHESSFNALAETVSKNVRPRAILDELLRLGIVHVDAEDRVHLDVRGFVPSADFDAKAFYFGEALHDHIASGAHNLGGRKPGMLERSVYYDELSPASIEALAHRSEELAMRMLQDINRDGMALERSDPPPPGQRMRMRLGVYFHAAPFAEPPPPARPARTPKRRSRR
jgi:hypothetical protein